VVQIEGDAVTTDEIRLAMEHSKPAGELLGMPFRIVDKEFLDDETIAILGYPEAPEKAVCLVNYNR